MRISGQVVPPASGVLDAASKKYVDENAVGIYSFFGEASIGTDETIDFEFGPAAYAGRAIGVSIEVATARTSGTITADLQVATVTKLTATIDGTNTVSHSATNLTNTHTVVADDSLRVRVTSSGYAAAVDVRIQAFFSVNDIRDLPTAPSQADFVQAHVGLAALLAGADANGDVRYTGTPPGQMGTAVTVNHVVAGTNTSLSVSVTTTNVTVNVATDGGGLPTSTAADVASAVNGDGSASALVVAEAQGTGLSVVADVGPITLSSDAESPDYRVVWDTIDDSRGSSISLDKLTGVFTLAPGFYYIHASMHCYRSGTGMLRVFQLYDETNAALVAGTDCASFNSLAGNGTGGHPATICLLAVETSTDYSIQLLTNPAVQDIGDQSHLCIIKLDA